MIQIASLLLGIGLGFFISLIMLLIISWLTGD